MPGPKRIDIDRVLTEAMYRFWHHGYAATSVGDLVAAMGIPRQSVYNLFGSKRQLFLRVLDHYDRTVIRPTQAKFASRTSPRRAVLELFDDAVSQALRDDHRHGCFVVNAAVEMAPHDTDVAASTAGVLSAGEEFFRELIEKGKTLDEFSVEVTPEPVAKALIGLIVSISVLARACPDEHLLRTILKQAEQLLPTPR